MIININIPIYKEMIIPLLNSNKYINKKWINKKFKNISHKDYKYPDKH